MTSSTSTSAHSSDLLLTGVTVDDAAAIGGRRVELVSMRCDSTGAVAAIVEAHRVLERAAAPSPALPLLADDPFVEGAWLRLPFRAVPSIRFDRILGRAVDVGEVAAPLVVAWLLDVVDGLGLLHARGWAHGRVHPALLAAGLDGTARLVVACVPRETVAAAAHGARDDAYVCPDVKRGSAAASRADVYALGVVAHELLTGRTSRDGPPALHTLVSGMTAPEPWKRPSIVDVQTALRALPAWLHWTPAQAATELRALFPHECDAAAAAAAAPAAGAPAPFDSLPRGFLRLFAAECAERVAALCSPDLFVPLQRLKRAAFRADVAELAQLRAALADRVRAHAGAVEEDPTRALGAVAAAFDVHARVAASVASTRAAALRPNEAQWQRDRLDQLRSVVALWRAAIAETSRIEEDARRRANEEATRIESEFATEESMQGYQPEQLASYIQANVERAARLRSEPLSAIALWPELQQALTRANERVAQLEAGRAP